MLHSSSSIIPAVPTKDNLFEGSPISQHSNNDEAPLLPIPPKSYQSKPKVTIIDQSHFAEEDDQYKNSTEKSNESKDIVESLFSVTGMTCGACVAAIEQGLEKQNGISQVKVTLLTNQASVTHDENQIGVRDIIQAIEDLGYDAQPVLPSELNQQKIMDQFKKHKKELTIQLAISLLFAIPSFIIDMVIEMFLSAQNPVRKKLDETFIAGNLSVATFISWLLATGIIVLVGYRFFIKAYKSLWYSGVMGMDSLVALGVLVSYVASVTHIILNLTRRRETSYTHQHNESRWLSHPSFEVGTFLITFVLLGRYLETIAKAKTLQALNSLTKLQPETAILLLEIGEGVYEEKTIPIELVQTNDLIKVNGGKGVPCDGVIEFGFTNIQEAMLTGEPLPIVKNVGDTVLAGSVNVTSPIHVRVLHTGTQTTLYKIVDMVQRAQASKAPIEQLADRLAQRFVPLIIILSIATVILWIILGSKNLISPNWIPENYSWVLFAIFTGVSVLVIACPCALGLASPTAVMVGTGIAAKQGILIQGGGKTLQLAHRVQIVCFDKTGTLTLGQPQVKGVAFISNPTRFHSVLTKRNTLEIVSEVEKNSEHPLAKALVHFVANDSKIQSYSDQSIVKILELKEVPGKGIVGKVKLSQFEDNSDILDIAIGNLELMEDHNIKLSYQQCDTAQLQLIQTWQDEGQSVLFVGAKKSTPYEVFGEVLMAFGLSDTIRPEAKQVVKQLTEWNIQVWMITGDTYSTATQVAKEVGITNIFAKVLPQNKAEAIKKLQTDAGSPETAAYEKGSTSFWIRLKALGRRLIFSDSFNQVQTRTNTVAMIGDGINDAIAMAQSDVGIAMGASTDLTLNTADVILLKSRLGQLLTLIDLSKTVTYRIYWNFLWATGYNLVGIPLAMGLLYPIAGVGIPPVLAGGLMVLSSLSVMANSLWLLRYKSKFTS